MAGYTKLFNSILMSSIWGEDDVTRIVWITMLAMADRFGRVDAALSGLAHAARVPVEACEKSVKTLESPDVQSRSSEFEGRRIEKVDGGWILLNHAKYRAKLSEDERREYFRVKKQEQRASKNVQNVKDNGADVKVVTQAEAEAEAEKVKTIVQPKALDVPFESFWNLYPRKEGKAKASSKWKHLTKPMREEAILGLVAWKESGRWTDPQFIPHATTYLNGRRWEDEIVQAVAVRSAIDQAYNRESQVGAGPTLPPGARYVRKKPPA